MARSRALLVRRPQAYSRTLMGNMQLPPQADAAETTPSAAADLFMADASALLWDLKAEGAEGAEASPFEMILPSMRLQPRAPSPAQAEATPVKATPALFSPMVAPPRDLAFSPESEVGPTPPSLHARTAARSAARSVPATSAAAAADPAPAAGGASSRVAWGQWGALETKAAPAPKPLTPATPVHAAAGPLHEQRPPRRLAAASTAASPPPLAAPSSLGARSAGRHMAAAPPSLMGAPMRVCKPSALAAPLTLPPASYAPHTAGLAVADAILAAASPLEPFEQQLQLQSQHDDPDAGWASGRNSGSEQRSSAGVLQATLPTHSPHPPLCLTCSPPHTRPCASQAPLSAPAQQNEPDSPMGSPMLTAVARAPQAYYHEMERQQSSRVHRVRA